MNQNRPFLGILLMIGFSMSIPISDAIVKILGQDVGIVLVLLVRFAVQTLLLLPIAIAGREQILPPRSILGMTIIRTLLLIGGIGTMFISLQYLAMVDAIAIAYVMPFLSLILGWMFLNEEVGLHRLGACIAGFVGTLLVIQPNFVTVGWPALWPLACAGFFSAFMLVTRSMSKHVKPIPLQIISGAQASILLFPLLFLFPEAAKLDAVTPRIVWLLLTMGAVGTVAHLFMTSSLRFAPAATLAPIQYVEIPFTTLVGWIVFSDLPNGLATVGILISVASGLYIIFRERHLAVRPKVPAAPPAG